MKNDNLHPLIIALDAMGGDHAPEAVVHGAYLSMAKHSNVEFIFYGDEQLIEPLINRYCALKKVSTITHTDKSVSPHTKPSIALKTGRDSSMGLAIAAVKDKKAHAMISSGNTGALMAIALIQLRTLPEIHRPAIAAILPSLQGKIVMLDLGANAECSATNLLQFAIMGQAFAKIILGISNPKIGLLNVGTEDSKGTDAVKLAFAAIKNNPQPLNFHGFVEGNDIAAGTVDVVVTDGFSGNIALKTAEGMGKLCKELIKKAFRHSTLSRLGYFLAKSSITKSFSQIDHRFYNGAMLLGLNGIVIKSHGSADEHAFANAISIAVELADKDINNQISIESN